MDLKFKTSRTESIFTRHSYRYSFRSSESQSTNGEIKSSTAIWKSILEGIIYVWNVFFTWDILLVQLFSEVSWKRIASFVELQLALPIGNLSPQTMEGLTNLLLTIINMHAVNCDAPQELFYNKINKSLRTHSITRCLHYTHLFSISILRDFLQIWRKLCNNSIQIKSPF